MDYSKKHLELISELVTLVLKDCLIEDIRTKEVSNVSSRIIKKIEDATLNVDFSEEIISSGIKRLFKKSSNKILDSLQNSDDGIDKIANNAIKTILDGDLFDKDDEWLSQYIKGHINKFIYMLLKHYFEALFQKTEFSMMRSWDDAELLTFGKEQSRFRMSELDRILKSGNGFNAWLDKKRGDKTILSELIEDYCTMHEGAISDKLEDGVKLCDWDSGFRNFCLEKYNEK